MKRFKIPEENEAEDNKAEEHTRAQRFSWSCEEDFCKAFNRLVIYHNPSISEPPIEH